MTINGPFSLSDAGSAAFDWTKQGSALLLFLRNPCELDARYRDAGDESWTVEVKPGSRAVVARCDRLLSEQELVLGAGDMIPRFFDFLAARHPRVASLPYDRDNSITFFARDGSRVLRYTDIAKTVVEAHMELSVQPPAGAESVAQQKRVPWVPALRYFRWALASQNADDAYRNLWLSFELCLDELCPKLSDEREAAWVKRALFTLGKQVDLASFAPAKHPNPAAYILGTQYEYMRNRLFHSKRDSKSRLTDLPDLQTLLQHYRELRRLIGATFTNLYGIVPNSGASVSSEAFFAMMDAAYGPAKMCFSFIGAAQLNSTPQLSSQNTEQQFEQTQYSKQLDTVMVTLLGRSNVTDAIRGIPINRLYGTYKDEPGIISESPEPFVLGALDTFEACFIGRQADNLAPAAFI